MLQEIESPVGSQWLQYQACLQESPSPSPLLTRLDEVEDIPDESTTPLQTTPSPSKALPPWYPSEWDVDVKIAVDTSQEWPPIRRSSSLTSRTRTHVRSRSEPITILPPSRRQPRPNSSTSSSSSGSSSVTPQKSILHRTSSTITTRTAKSLKSVKFVDIPEVLYQEPDEESPLSPEEPTPVEKESETWMKSLRKFLLDYSPPRFKLKNSDQPQPAEPPQRPEISLPYRLYSGSCPTLSLTARDVDSTSLCSVKSTQSAKQRSNETRMNGEKTRLDALWKSWFTRRGKTKDGQRSKWFG